MLENESLVLPILSEKKSNKMVGKTESCEKEVLFLEWSVIQIRPARFFNHPFGKIFLGRILCNKPCSRL